MRFDEHRPVYSLAQIFDGRVEPLRVAYLQRHPLLFAQSYEPVGLLQRCRYRFFQQHVFALFQKVLRHLEVLACRHGDAHGIHVRSERRVVAEGLCANFGRHVSDALFVDVDDAHEFDRGQRCQVAGVVITEMADSHHAGL